MTASSRASTKVPGQSTKSPGKPADGMSADKSALRGMDFAQQTAALMPGSAAGGGEPLPPAVRLKMERALGGDFADIRVHVDGQAAKLGAKAFTRGSDIFFAPGLYQPESTRGQELLGHELAHVVQQGKGKVTDERGGINEDKGLEGAADALGAKAARGDAGGAGEAVKPVASGPVQRKKGDDVWARARDMLRHGDDREIDADLVRVLAGLLATYDEGPIESAMLSVGRHAFTSVARGVSIIQHLGLGLMPLLVAQGAEVCLDDTLGQVLALSLALQSGGVNVIMTEPALRAELAASGRAHPAIVTAFTQVGPLMTGGARALALVDHLVAGGTAIDAGRAVTYAGDDVALLGEALTALRGLGAIEGADTLGALKLGAVLGERQHLTSDTLRLNAVKLAAGSEDAVTALAESRAFGYRPDFKQHAEDKGEQAKQELESERAKEIRAKAEQDKQGAIERQGEDAFKSLTRKPRRTLTGNTDKFKDIKPRPKKGDTGMLSEAWGEYDKQRKLSAQAETDEIDRVKDVDLEHVTTTEGPAEKTRVVDEQQQFFQSTGFHPDALVALRLAQDDTTDAKAIVDLIVRLPAIRPLFTSVVLDSAELERALAQGDLLATHIGQGVTPTNLKSYLQSDNKMSLLTLLGGVGGARVNALVASFGSFDTALQSSVERGHLATLCGHYTPTVIATLQQKMPGKTLGTLVALQPAALDAQALVAAFAACTKLAWKAQALIDCVGLLVAQTGPQLCEAIYVAHLQKNPSTGNIESFVRAVSNLMELGFLSVAASGGWENLNNAGETYELPYDVERTSNGNVVDSFVVHFHPNASKKDVKKHDALSRSHIKATRHTKPHVRRDAVPVPLRSQCDWEC